MELLLSVAMLGGCVVAVFLAVHDGPGFRLWIRGDPHPTDERSLWAVITPMLLAAALVAAALWVASVPSPLRLVALITGALVIVWMRFDYALEELWSGKSWRDAPEPYAPRRMRREDQGRTALRVLVGVGVAVAMVVGLYLTLAVSLRSGG